MLDLLFLSHGATLGGAQKSLLEALLHKPESISCALLIPELGPLGERLIEEGIPVDVAPISFYEPLTENHRQSLRKALWQAPVAALVLSRSFKRLQPKVVVANSLALLPSIIIAQLCGYTLVIHCREHLPMSSRLERIFVRFALKRAKAVLVESDFIRSSLKGRVEATKLQLVSNWAYTANESTDVTSMREQLGLSDKDFVVGFAGQLIPEKGFFDLLQAAFILVAKGVQVRFLVIGDTILSPSNEVDTRIRAQIDALGLGKYFHCVGFHVDPTPYLAACDAIAVIPTKPESFGRTAIEAMALGKALITTALGGLQELVTADVDALVVPSKNPQALAAALTLLAEQPPLRAELGLRAARRAKEFRAQERIPDYWNVLQKLLEDTYEHANC